MFGVTELVCQMKQDHCRSVSSDFRNDGEAVCLSAISRYLSLDG